MSDCAEQSESEDGSPGVESDSEEEESPVRSTTSGWVLLDPALKKRALTLPLRVTLRFFSALVGFGGESVMIKSPSRSVSWSVLLLCLLLIGGAWRSLTSGAAGMMMGPVSPEGVKAGSCRMIFAEDGRAGSTGWVADPAINR